MMSTLPEHHYLSDFSRGFLPLPCYDLLAFLLLRSSVIARVFQCLIALQEDTRTDPYSAIEQAKRTVVF